MPMEIIGLNKPEVKFVWDDAHEATWSSRDLRLACTCAHCVSEATGERLLDPEKVPADIVVKDIELMGNYGIRIGFSDGHGTGIYRFDALLASCPCAHCRARRDAKA